MPGMFDDLIPTENKQKYSFDDLIPDKKKVTPQRERARENVRELGQEISEYLPGMNLREFLPKSGPGAYLTAPLNSATHLVDEGIKNYANAYWGGIRGIPIAGAFADEAIASVSSALGGDYDNALEHIRALDDVSEKNYPVANTSGKLIGGLAGGYGIGAKVVSKGAPLAANLIRSGLSGAVVAGSHEFGNAEGGTNKRLEKARDGAVLGGMISTAIPALPAVAAPIRTVAKKVIPKRYQKTFADDEILRALEADDLTPMQAFRKYNKGQKNTRFHSNSKAQNPEALVDLGDNLTRLGRTVTTNGKATKIGTEFVNKRQLSQNDRINDALERGLRQKSSDDFYKSKDKLVREQREASKPAYDKAFSNAKPVVIDDLIEEWAERASLTSDTIGKKMSKAIKDISRANKTNDPMRALRVINGAKQGLDDAIAKSRLKSPNLARELTIMKNELLERVDKVNPHYKAARDVYKNNAELLDAQNVGRSFLKGDVEVNVKSFRGLSQPEKEMFRKGVIQELKKKMGDSRFTHDRTKFFDNPNAREVLKVVFQKDTKKFAPYKQFIDLIESEANFVRTRNKIIGGSPTASRLADNQEFALRSAGNFMDRAKDGRLLEAVMGSLARKAEEFWSVKANDAEAIAKLLFSDNPKAISQTLLRLHRKYGQEKTNKLIDQIGESYGRLSISGQAGIRD
ncbi:MAG: hypothetical protein JJ964_05815 [Rhizobiales bacterium]|nr:hypothetical protein [Hyphomicrobiales bacterium]